MDMKDVNAWAGRKAAKAPIPGGEGGGEEGTDDTEGGEEGDEVEAASAAIATSVTVLRSEAQALEDALADIHDDVAADVRDAIAELRSLSNDLEDSAKALEKLEGQAAKDAEDQAKADADAAEKQAAKDKAAPSAKPPKGKAPAPGLDGERTRVGT